MIIETSNWGRFPKVDAEVLPVTNNEQVKDLLLHTSFPLIARGNGRCYGDSALQRKIISTLSLNKMLALDLDNRTIRVQAGVLLEEILRLLVPKGFFLPVVPGTKMITVGGAIAGNVHGKNHHLAGAFGRYVSQLTLINSAGEKVSCSPEHNSDLFKRTIGGMGTTGVITDATLQLKPIATSYFQQDSLSATSLSHLLELFEANKAKPYLVAWVDGLAPMQKLGRGTLHTGTVALQEDLISQGAKTAPLRAHSLAGLSIPSFIPGFLLNRLSIELNNRWYRWKHRFAKSKVVHYDQFFFPLDRLKHWNRLYGRSGLLQYQVVLPIEQAEEGLHSLLSCVQASGLTPYLIVLKLMGAEARLAAPTSFPMHGYTLAIDFKNTPTALQLLDTLDQLTLQYKGRVYLCKDARLSADIFRKMYPGAAAPEYQFQSLQTQRIFNL